MSGYGIVILIGSVGLQAKITAVGFHPHSVFMHRRIEFLVHRQLRCSIGSACLAKEGCQTCADLRFSHIDSHIVRFGNEFRRSVVVGVLRGNIGVFLAGDRLKHTARTLLTYRHHLVSCRIVQFDAYSTVRNHQIDRDRIYLCHLQGVGGGCATGSGQYYRDDIGSVLSSLTVSQLYSSTLTTDSCFSTHSYSCALIQHSGCHEHRACTGGHCVIQDILFKFDLHGGAVTCGFQAPQAGAADDLNGIGLILLVAIGILYQTTFQSHGITVQTICYKNIGQGGFIALPGSSRFITLQEHLMGAAVCYTAAPLNVAENTAVCIIRHIIGSTRIGLVGCGYFLPPVCAGSKADLYILHPLAGRQRCLQACFSSYVNAAADMLIAAIRNIKGILTGNKLHLRQIPSGHLGSKLTGKHSFTGIHHSATLHDLHGDSYGLAVHKGLKGIDSSLQIVCKLFCIGGIIEFLVSLDIGCGSGRIRLNSIGRSIVPCQLGDQVVQCVRIALTGVGGDPQSGYIFSLGIQIITIIVKMQHIGTGHTLDSANVALIDTGKVEAAVLQGLLDGFAALVIHIAGLNDIAVLVDCQECKLTRLFNLQRALVANLIVVCIGMLTGAFDNALKDVLFTLSGRVFHSSAQLTANTKGIATAVGIAFFGGNTQLNNGVSALPS